MRTLINNVYSKRFYSFSYTFVLPFLFLPLFTCAQTDSIHRINIKRYQTSGDGHYVPRLPYTPHKERNIQYHIKSEAQTTIIYMNEKFDTASFHHFFYNREGEILEKFRTESESGTPDEYYHYPFVYSQYTYDSSGNLLRITENSEPGSNDDTICVITYNREGYPLMYKTGGNTIRYWPEFYQNGLLWQLKVQGPLLERIQHFSFPNISDSNQKQTTVHNQTRKTYLEGPFKINCGYDTIYCECENKPVMIVDWGKKIHTQDTMLLLKAYNLKKELIIELKWNTYVGYEHGTLTKMSWENGRTKTHDTYQLSTFNKLLKPYSIEYRTYMYNDKDLVCKQHICKEKQDDEGKLIQDQLHIIYYTYTYYDSR